MLCGRFASGSLTSIAGNVRLIQRNKPSVTEHASSDKLRAGARCTSCGCKGVTLQHPGWAGNHIGFYPFPTEIADQMRDDDPTRTL
jgi:hypothetical protein